MYGNSKVIDLPYIKPYLEETNNSGNVTSLIKEIKSPVKKFGGPDKVNTAANELNNLLDGTNVNELKEIVFQIPGILVKVIDDYADIESKTIKTEGNERFVEKNK